MSFARQRAGLTGKSEGRATKHHPHITSASQLIENTIRRPLLPEVSSETVNCRRSTVDSSSACLNRNAPRNRGGLTPRKQRIGLPLNRNKLAGVYQPFPRLTANPRLSTVTSRLSTCNFRPFTADCAPAPHESPVTIHTFLRSTVHCQLSTVSGSLLTK